MPTKLLNIHNYLIKNNIYDNKQNTKQKNALCIHGCGYSLRSCSLQCIQQQQYSINVGTQLLLYLFLGSEILSIKNVGKYLLTTEFLLR